MPPDQLLDADLHSVRHTLSPGLKICGQAFDGTLDTVTPYGPDQWAAQSLQLLKNFVSLKSSLLVPLREAQPYKRRYSYCALCGQELAYIFFDSFHPNLTQEYTETVQDLFHNTLQTLLRLPALEPPHKRIITLPIAHGGMAFPHLPTLAIAARISMLATIPRTPANHTFFHSHLRDELNHLGTQFDALIEGRTADILGQIAEPPPGRSFRGLQKKTHDATPYPNWSRSSPWP